MPSLTVVAMEYFRSSAKNSPWLKLILPPSLTHGFRQAMSSKSSMQVTCGNCACLLSSKRTSHGLGQRLVSTCLLQPLLYRWRNHVKGITAGDEHLWRIWHRGNFDKRVAQLRRVARLRAVILRPHFLGRALRRVVLDDLADPSDILRVEQIRSEETGFDHGDLDAEFLHFGRD